jgi:hypothetical protein
MTIECTKFTPLNKGVLVGFADLYVAKMDLEIYGCQFCNKDGRRWLNMPQKEYVKDNEKKYLSIVRFRDKVKQDMFAEAAIKAIEKKIGEQAAAPKQHSYEDLQGELPF